MSTVLTVYVFAVGAVVGSFLNVVIHRYPLEQSIVYPKSRCPKCGTAIRWYDNVPLLSFLVLRGRCRACRNPISGRYPMVELSNALFYLAVFLRTGISVAFVFVAAIVSMAIVLIFIDLDIQILPDVIDLPGVLLGLGIGWLRLGDSFTTLTLSSSLLQSALGAVIGAAIPLAIGIAYKLVRKIEGMGLGDVKMLAMIGAVLGWEPLFPVLVIASAAGAVVGVGVAARSKLGLQVPLPFGVFLGLAALLVLFFGRTLHLAPLLPG